MEEYEKIDNAVKSLRPYFKKPPEIGIILGTGLGQLAEKINKENTIPYKDIPDFPLSTVETHTGRLIFGTLAGKQIVAMQGRFHFYEGYSMAQITFPVRVMKALGASTLIVSNACGGLNPSFSKGDVMVIMDHINLLGTNPLIGKNDERLGPRFPDMSEPYCRKLIKLAGEAAAELSYPLRQGVYACMSGPSLETAAEYRFLQIIKADVIGMSTVPEVIVAVHSGLKVLGLSVITDLCQPDNLTPVNIQEIIETAEKAESKLVAIIERTIEKIAENTDL
ncbi:MAG: purine-nucleoside phosphorylase [bacterium]